MLPAPGIRRTRATAVLRRPVAQMMFFFSAMIKIRVFALDFDRLRPLRHVGMLGAAVDLQLSEQLPAQAILRKHPFHRRFNKPLGTSFQEPARRRGADAAGVLGMSMVELVGSFGRSEERR